MESGKRQERVQVATERIGRFRLMGILGEGGMGVVYEAYDDQLARKVAVKVLRADTAGDNHRLILEARALAQLAHPNVVAVHEVGHHGGDVFVAMEHIAGKSLRRYFDDHTDWAARMEMLVQAGEGLRAAHSAGLIHRDFKPENVIVGDDGRVRVVDFGLAKTSSEAAAAPPVPDREGHRAPDPLTSLTCTGAVVGTPLYMAPEQWLGQPSDARTDQFAFSVTAFEAIFGKRPFAGTTAAEVADAVEAGRIDPPPKSTPIPEALQAAVLRGLAVDPDERHPDMAALLAAIAPCLHGPRSHPRSRRSLIAAALAVVAVAGVLAVLLSLTRGDPDRAVAMDPHAAIIAASHLPELLPESLAGDPMAVTVHRLKNGLTVYLSPDRTAPRIQAYVLFRAGSRHDPPGAAGLSHVLEHMLFRGTESLGTTDYDRERPALEHIRALYDQLAAAGDDQRDSIVRQIATETAAASRFAVPNDFVDTLEAIGGRHIGAWVTMEAMAYHADIPSNRLEDWARLESDRFQHAVFRLYYPEIGALLEGLRDDNDVRSRQLAASRRGLFSGHLYARPTPGTIATLSRQPFSTMVDYFHTWFVPNNAAIVLAGNIDRDHALNILERAFATWEPRPLPQFSPPPPAKLQKPVHTRIPTSSSVSLSVSWQTVPIGHPDELPLRVFDQLFSRLIARRLRAGHDITAIGSHIRFLHQAGVWGAQSDVRNEAQLDRALAIIDDLIAAIQRGDFTDQELAAVKLHMALARQRAVTDNDHRALRIARSFFHGESWPEHLAKEDALMRIDRDEIIAVARRYLGKNRVVVKSVPGAIPEVTTGKLPASALSLSPGRQSALGKAVRDRAIVPLQPRFLYPGRDYERAATAHGPLVAAKNPVGDEFSLTLAFATGKARSTPLCAALDAVTYAGTAAGKSAGERRDSWYQLGLAVTHRCDADRVTISISGPDAAFEQDIDKVFQWLLAPAWTSAAFSRFRIHYAQDRELSPLIEPRARRDLREAALYRQNGRWSWAPTAAEIAAMTPQRVRVLIAALLATEAHVTYLGPRPAAGVKRILDANLPPPAKPASGQPARRPALAPRRPRILAVNWPGASTATVNVYLALPAKPENQLKVRLIRAYLKDRLHAAAEPSLAAGATVAVTFGVAPEPALSVIEISMTVPPAAIDRAVSTALALMRAPPDAGDLARARAQLDKHFRTLWITPADVPATVDKWFRAGFAGDPRPARFQSLATMTTSDLAPLVAKLAGTAPIVTLFGDLSGTRPRAIPGLGEIEWVTPDDIAFPRGH